MKSISCSQNRSHITLIWKSIDTAVSQMKLIFTLKKNHFEMMRYRYRKHLLPDMARD